MLINSALWILSKGARGPLLKKSFAEMGRQVLIILRAYLVAAILRSVIGGGVVLRDMLWMGVGFIFLIFAEGLLHYQGACLSVRVGTKVKEVLRKRLLSNILLLEPSYTHKHRAGDICNILVAKIEALDPYYAVYIPALVATIFTGTAVTIYLFTVDVYVALVCLLGILIVLIVPSFWIKIMDARGKEDWRLYSELGADMLDNLEGMPTLKAFNASGKRKKYMEEKAWEMHRATMKNLSISLIESGILQGGAALGQVLSVGVGIMRTLQGHLVFTDMVFILFLVNACFSPVFALINAWHLGFRGVTASHGILQLWQKETEEKTPKKIETAYPIAHKPDKENKIFFNRIHFRYENAEEFVLKDIHFGIRDQEVTALVGKSGAGKTTLVYLLSRFYAPNQGQIWIEGKDIAAMTESELWSKLGVVWQNPYFFYGTLMENLRLGKKNATEKEVEQACRSANIHDFIMQLPDQYHTKIGERGIRLSGGEKQRLAIARCFLKNPPIIIFDEATANLDGENEAKVQESMKRLMGGKTAIIIAHRLSTIMDADTIAVLAEGHIVERGSHEALLSKEGNYHHLVQMQLGGMSHGA